MVMVLVVIVISNQKGGTGKTACAVNLSAALALAGKRTLLLDLDPQGHSTTSLGIEKGGLNASMYDVMIGKTSLAKVILKTGVDGLRVGPANIDLAGVEFEFVSRAGREYVLRDMLKKADDEYNVCVLDTPPNLGLLTINGLCAADWLIIPISVGFLPLEGLKRLLDVVELVRTRLGARAKLLGSLITFYDERTRLSKESAMEIRRFFQDRCFKTVIHRCVKIAEAPSFGETIFTWAPGTRAAEEFRAVAEEVMELV